MAQPSGPDHDQRLKVLLKYVEGLKRIAQSEENDFRRFLLAECLEAYAELDEAQKERVQALVHTEPYQEVESLMKTTYERGIETGIERGIERGIAQGIERGIEQGERRLTVRLLEAKFGPLSAEVREQLEALSPEALAQPQLDLLQAQSLKELRI